MDEAIQLLQQLSTLGGELVKVQDLIQTLCEGSSDAAVVESVVNARLDLIEGVIMLNDFLFQSGADTGTLRIGSLVLAPRFSDGGFHHDLAIITSLKIEAAPGDSVLMEPCHCRYIDHISLSVSGENDRCILSIVWARPRTKYELYATGVSFSVHQIKNGAELFLRKERSGYDHICVGDKVWYMADPGLSHGVWRRGFVHSVSDGIPRSIRLRCNTTTQSTAVAAATTTTAAIQKSCSAAAHQADVYLSLPLNSLHIALQLNSGRGIDAAAPFDTDNPVYSRSSLLPLFSVEGRDDKEEDGITSLPSYSYSSSAGISDCRYFPLKL
jgi:hypothetical protein